MSRSLLFGIFALSLAFRLWFNFAFPHINNAGAADGSEYLRLAESLRQFFGHQGGDFSMLTGFKQSGPVFPLFIFFCQQVGSIFGELPGWTAPVFGQCLLASSADVFLTLIANMLWGKTAALSCAVFTIFYPAYVVNSGRLYSESFSTSICIIILYLMCRGFVGEKRKGAQIFGLGIGLAMLQLARSVMILLSVIALPLTFFQERKSGAIKSVILLISAMALVIIPWLFAQNAVFNKASLVVDRVGNYNLFVGTNCDISGWLSYPYPDGTGVEKRSAISVLKANVKRSSSRFIKLMLDKPYRLAKFPWNDFRTDVALLNFPLQVVFHQLLLLLCAMGICLAFVRNDDGQAPDKSVFYGRLFLLLFLASHAIYFLFITVPRYNMTATPVMILFAAAGLAASISLARQNACSGAILLNAFFVIFLTARLNEIGLLNRVFANPQLALLVLCILKGVAALIFFFVLLRLFPQAQTKKVFCHALHIAVSLMAVFLLIYPARANGRAFEWQTILEQKGDKIAQQIAFSKSDVAALKGKQLYVLIDTDGAKDFVENGQATANGEVLLGPVIPGIALTQDFSAEKQMSDGQIYFECEWIYDCMTASSGIASSEIRQWFVMPVPPKAVQKALSCGLLTVEIENITGAHAFKIFGSYSPKDSRPSINSSSWEKAFYGVENDRGFTDSRYDAKLDVARHTVASFLSKDKRDDQDLSLSPGLQNGTFNLLLSACKSKAATQVITVSHALPEKVSIASGAKKLFSASVSSTLPIQSEEVWLFRLQGKSWAPKDVVTVEPKLRVMVKDDAGKTHEYPCRWLPRKLPNGSIPQRFDYCFPMMPSLLKEKISTVQVALERTDNYSDPGATLEIEDFSLEIIPLSANPISAQNGIY